MAAVARAQCAILPGGQKEASPVVVFTMMMWRIFFCPVVRRVC